MLRVASYPCKNNSHHFSQGLLYLMYQARDYFIHDSKKIKLDVDVSHQKNMCVVYCAI